LAFDSKYHKGARLKPSRIFSHWEQVRSDLVATVAKFSQTELSFVVAQHSWPVGQIMLHIADCEDNWLHGVVQGEFEPWIFYSFSDYPTTAAILEVLNQARQRTIAFLDGLEESDLDNIYTLPGGGQVSLFWILWHVLEHEIHHRGELSLILGMLGHEGLDV
jgi:uncharacterized damage-inducible protein DinB